MEGKVKEEGKGLQHCCRIDRLYDSIDFLFSLALSLNGILPICEPCLALQITSALNAYIFRINPGIP